MPPRSAACGLACSGIAAIAKPQAARTIQFLVLVAQASRLSRTGETPVPQPPSIVLVAQASRRSRTGETPVPQPSNSYLTPAPMHRPCGTGVSPVPYRRDAGATMESALLH